MFYILKSILRPKKEARLTHAHLKCEPRYCLKICWLNKLFPPKDLFSVY